MMRAKSWLKWGGLILLIVGVVMLVRCMQPYFGSALEPIPTAPALTEVLIATSSQTSTPAPTATNVAATSETEDINTPAPDITDTPMLPSATPTATPTAIPTGEVPVQVIIEDIDLDAPVKPIGWIYMESGGQRVPVWDVPDEFAAGWHNTSAKLGDTGNTVLNGHNTNHGEVFRDLYKLDIGASISVVSESGETYLYRITEKYILLEAGQPLDERLKNAEYIQATDDERLTLVTCHPYGSLRNRLIIIALPNNEAVSESSRDVQKGE